MEVKERNIYLEPGEEVTIKYREKQPEEPVQPVKPKDKGKLKYKVGLMSDLHFGKDGTHDLEQKPDLINALEVFHDYGVSFVECAGDFVMYEDQDFEDFHRVYADYGRDKYHLPLFACMGNHDYLRMFHVRSKEDKYTDWGTLYKYIGMWQAVSSFLPSQDDVDVHYFEYGLPWDGEPYSGSRRTKSKMNYWFEKDGDIHVIVCLDYGTDKVGDPWDCVIRGINLVDQSDTYAKQVAEYVKDTDYDAKREANYNYQFYQSEVLVWLKGLVEANKDKRIFVITHLPLPNKTGDTNCIYRRNRMFPVPASATIKNKYYSGSNMLCGIQFWFWDRLLRENRNIVHISGHTHFGSGQQVDKVTRHYIVQKPTGDEVTPIVDDISSLNGTKYDYKVYRTVGSSVDDCAPCIHLPSLTKPSKADNTEEYGASECVIMEVYERGVVFKYIRCKDAGDTKYKNQVVNTIEI